MTRELSEKGIRDINLVTSFFEDKNVDIVLSSPYKRAADTVSDLAEKNGLTIEVIDDFRERKVGDVWIDDFIGFCKSQWADFEYKLSNGESLCEVQARNIYALQNVLERFAGKTIVVGSHGTALSTIINYYDNRFGHKDFEKIKGLMPWVVKFVFENNKCTEIKQYDLFEI